MFIYILISWLFPMGSHWQHWTAKSSLSALAVSNGGVHHQFYPGKSENLTSFQVLLLLHRALSFYINRNERPKMRNCNTYGILTITLRGNYRLIGKCTATGWGKFICLPSDISFHWRLYLQDVGFVKNFEIIFMTSLPNTHKYFHPTMKTLNIQTLCLWM